MLLIWEIHLSVGCDLGERIHGYCYFRKQLQACQSSMPPVIPGDQNADLYTTDRSLQEDADLIILSAMMLLPPLLFELGHSAWTLKYKALYSESCQECIGGLQVGLSCLLISEIILILTHTLQVPQNILQNLDNWLPMHLRIGCLTCTPEELAHIDP